MREEDFIYGDSIFRDYRDSRIRDSWDSGIRDYQNFQIDNLTKVLYVHRICTTPLHDWGREKHIGDLRPLYLTTQTLRIFSTWSFELGTSYLQNFARSCVKKLWNVELGTCWKIEENNIRKAGADLRGINYDILYNYISFKSIWSSYTVSADINK